MKHVFLLIVAFALQLLFMHCYFNRKPIRESKDEKPQAQKASINQDEIPYQARIQQLPAYTAYNDIK